MSIPSHSARPKLPALTTLRFFAAAAVVLFHARVIGILPGGPWWYQNFASIGYIGVNFFFVLSGFILIYTYSGSQLSAREFWQARFARIYPAYIVSLIAAAPFFFFAVHNLDLPFFAWSKQHLLTACLLTVTLLQAWVPNGALAWNSVCWSLSVEAFFYALFPLILLWTRDLRRTRLWLGIGLSCFASLALGLLYLAIHPDGAHPNPQSTTLFWKNVLSFNPIARLPEFLVGVFAGHLYLRTENHRRIATPLALGGVAVITAIVSLVGRIPSTFVSAAILSPAFAAIIYGIALAPKWTRLLEFSWLVLLGDASYSLYLLHSIVISKAYDAVPQLSHSLRVMTAMGAALGAALLCYGVIEKPARRALRPRRYQTKGELAPALKPGLRATAAE